MPLPVPEPGLVIGYSYLWKSEAARGLAEGVKDRPCVIVLAVRREAERTIVIVAPVTHSPPENRDNAVEIPLQTKQRLGLDDRSSWVMVNEVNRFEWPGADLRPIRRDAPDRFEFGVLPPALFQRIKSQLAACARAQRLHMVARSDEK